MHSKGLRSFFLILSLSSSPPYPPPFCFRVSYSFVPIADFMWQSFLTSIHIRAKFFGKIKNRSKVSAALGLPIFSKSQNCHGPSFQKLLEVFWLCTTQSNPAKHLFLIHLLKISLGYFIWNMPRWLNHNPSQLNGWSWYCSHRSWCVKETMTTKSLKFSETDNH